MKKLIAGALVGVAGAVALTMWLLTRSDRPAEYPTPEAAVLAACPADPEHPPQMLGDALYPAAYIVEDGIDIVWFRDGQRKPPGEIAVVGSTAPGKFRVVTCTATIETPPPIP